MDISKSADIGQNSQTGGIPVLAVQKGWLAVEKPPNVSVHNDPDDDMIHRLMKQLQSDQALAKELGATPPFFIQPVHRLDKETSGVLLLSTHKPVLQKLSERFMTGQVKKIYIALVHGTFTETRDSGQYDQWVYPLTKTAGRRTNPAGTGKLVDCLTRYRVMRQSQRYALLEIDLKTGRKHQIRRHAKLAGHPVTGDKRYGSKKSLHYLKGHCAYERLGLHCQSLSFVPPGHDQVLRIDSKNPISEIYTLLADDGV